MQWMQRSRELCVILLCALLFTNQLQAAPRRNPEIKLRWNELSAQILNKRVTVFLASGPVVEGDVQAVSADSIDLNVRKSSDTAAIAKGNRTIPRSTITSLDLHGKRIRSRVITTSVGAAILATSIAIAYNANDYVAVFTFIFGALAGLTVMIAGYFIANQNDRTLTWIIILPD